MEVSLKIHLVGLLLLGSGCVYTETLSLFGVRLFDTDSSPTTVENSPGHDHHNGHHLIEDLNSSQHNHHAQHNVHYPISIHKHSHNHDDHFNHPENYNNNHDNHETHGHTQDNISHHYRYHINGHHNRNEIHDHNLAHGYDQKSSQAREFSDVRQHNHNHNDDHRNHNYDIQRYYREHGRNDDHRKLTHSIHDHSDTQNHNHKRKHHYNTFLDIHQHKQGTRPSPNYGKPFTPKKTFQYPSHGHKYVHSYRKPKELSSYNSYHGSYDEYPLHDSYHHYNHPYNYAKHSHHKDFHPKSKDPQVPSPLFSSLFGHSNSVSSSLQPLRPPPPSPQCPMLYTRVGTRCIAIFSIAHMTWNDASTFCEGIFGNLFTFDHIMEFYDFVNFLKEKELSSSLWVGGRALDHEWYWTGKQRFMPLGTPYWAVRDNIQAPATNITDYDEWCASMNSEDYYYLSDAKCVEKKAPVCVLKSAEVEVAKGDTNYYPALDYSFHLWNKIYDCEDCNDNTKDSGNENSEESSEENEDELEGINNKDRKEVKFKEGDTKKKEDNNLKDVNENSGEKGNVEKTDEEEKLVIAINTTSEVLMPIDEETGSGSGVAEIGDDEDMTESSGGFFIWNDVILRSD